MIFHDVEQNSEVWMALRLGKITASQYSTIMANDGKEFGDPAKRYALQLALERITGKRSEVGFSNEHTERGHLQEPVARMLYEELNFVTVDNGGFFDCGFYGTSPDGLICKNGVVEIKAVIAPTHYDTLRRGSFDPKYKWQFQGHIDGTDREWVDSVSYCSEFPEEKQLIIHRVFRDDKMITSLQSRRSNFNELVLLTMENIRMAS